MDTNAQQPTPPVKPMNEPHTPISESEMGIEPEHSSNRSSLLTIASVLVLAGIIIVTLWLFIQNKQANKISNQLSESQESKQVENTPVNTASTQITKISFKNIEEPLKIGPSTFKTIEVTDTDEKTINDNIGKFSNLTEVHLSRNNLKQIPEDLYNMTNLSTLWLASNEISSIPEDISKLKNLKILNLTSNKLTNLPKEIGDLDNLEELFLPTNFLTTLPAEISNLKKLKLLVLDGNFISDSEKERIEKLLPNTEVLIEHQRDPKVLNAALKE